jgi:hypothetical protein
LRPAGLVFRPQSDRGGDVLLRISLPEKKTEYWSVGFAPTDELPEGKLLPLMFEFVNIEVEDVPATEVLEAIGRNVKAPVLYDHNTLARHGIDLSKARLTVPATKSTYSLLLNRQLYKPKAKYEIRADDAGHPILWITAR